MIAILVVTMLLWAPLMPALGDGPSRGGDGGQDPSGTGPGEGSFASTDDDVIPLYTIVKGPDDASSFGGAVANMWDVNGDGLDDILVGSGWDVYIEKDPRRDADIWPYWNIDMLLPGRSDRGWTAEQLEPVSNSTSMFIYPGERWLGDVNGDGYTDMVSSQDNYIDWREPGQMPPYQYGNWLEVRYGTEDGLPTEVDLVLDLRNPDVPENSWISFQYGGVGDVNGDGYNDLFVYRQGIEVWEEPPPGGGRDDGDPDEPPRPDPNITFIPPDFMLFYGSEDGFPETSSWNGTPEFLDRYVYLEGVNHADVNGDGYSDIILTSSMAPHIRVYHGSAEGMPLEPSTTITFNTQYVYGWRLHAPVDINGDEFDDVVVNFGDTEGLSDFVQYIYVLPGSARGIPARLSTHYKISSYENGRVVMSDVNGDGLDDVFISTTEQVGTREQINLRLQLHFNTGEGFPLTPSWQHMIASLDGVTWSGSSDDGDFDGDGFGDIAVGVPGTTAWRPDGTYETYEGRVIIVNGGGIMDLLRPLSLRDGPKLYAGLKSYDFRVNGNPTGLTALPDMVRLTLDPGGADVMLEAGLLMGGSYIVEGSDPDDVVTLTSGLSDIVRDTLNNTVWVHFRVMFNWNWPHEDLSDVLVQTRLRNATTPFTSRDLFFVENDLDLIGAISATGEHQGVLAENAWVRAGETVTVSGPRVVYEGTTDVYPPSGVCDVVLQDNGGRFTRADLVSGATVSIALAMDASTDLDENLTITLQNLPGLATLVSQPRFHLRVDGDLPMFANAVPDPDDWHSSSQVLVSITADDSGTSGVRARTLEYAYSTDGGVTYTPWSREGLETTATGPTVDGLVLLTLPDGVENFVKWRATDVVGNGPAVSIGYRIKVDTINVTYTSAFPDPSVWQTVLSVECGVTIRDMDGAGIEAASVQYRISNQNLSGYGAWLDWDEGSMVDAQQLTVSQVMAMGDTPFNYVQWRAKDIAGNGYTTSPHYRIRVDTTPISFSDFAPVDGPFDHSTITCFLNVTDGDLGSGVNMASIEFRVLTGGGGWSEWQWAGMDGTRPFDRFSRDVTFEDGSDNRVQFRGWDVAGNGPGESDVYVFVVDTTGPEFGAIAPGEDEKQPGSEVTVTVTLWDAVVGLDVTSVRYRFTTSGSLPNDWMTVPVTSGGDGTHTAQVSITLAPGVDNRVQFKASDMLGHATESSIATIWVNRAPSAKIQAPISTELYREEDLVTLNATGSSDVDGDALNYTWYREGSAEPLGHGRVLDTSLPAGEYNITLVVRDVDGAEDTASVRIQVEEYVPPSTQIGGSSLWLVLLLLAIVVVGVAVLYRRRMERRMDVWEEI